MHCHQSIWKDGKPVFAGLPEGGGVMNDDMIDNDIELKMAEVARFEMTHPVEFDMYYSV